MAKYLSIGEQLKRAIEQAERRGLTRYQIAKLSGISEGQLSRLFNGTVTPRTDTAERIAAALGYRFRMEPTRQERRC